MVIYRVWNNHQSVRSACGVRQPKRQAESLPHTRVSARVWGVITLIAAPVSSQQRSRHSALSPFTALRAKGKGPTTAGTWNVDRGPWTVSALPCSLFRLHWSSEPAGQRASEPAKPTSQRANEPCHLGTCLLLVNCRRRLTSCCMPSGPTDSGQTERGLSS